MAENGKPANKELPSLLICPDRDIRIEAAFTIDTAQSIAELCTLIQNSSAAVSIRDILLTKCLVEYAELFGVEIALLAGVPGCDYSPAYEQVTWSLDRVGYDALAIEVQSTARMEALKQAERPRMAGNRPIPQSAEEVAAMKVPDDFETSVLPDE